MSTSFTHRNKTPESAIGPQCRDRTFTLEHTVGFGLPMPEVLLLLAYNMGRDNGAHSSLIDT